MKGNVPTAPELVTILPVALSSHLCCPEYLIRTRTRRGKVSEKGRRYRLKGKGRGIKI
jgi:hypothetical protein